MKTVLSHANLIDCVEPKVRPDSAVLIEDGRIRAILPSGEAGSAGDAQMIDLKGGHLMPGLWDVHIHPDYLKESLNIECNLRTVVESVWFGDAASGNFDLAIGAIVSALLDPSDYFNA